MLTSQSKPKLTDYNPKELIGKVVLRTQSYIGSSTRSLHKITKATMTTLTIENCEHKFLIKGGSRQGLGGRLNLGTHDDIELIDPVEANKLSLEWRTKKLRKQLIARLTEMIGVMEMADLKALIAFYNLNEKELKQADVRAFLNDRKG